MSTTETIDASVLSKVKSVERKRERTSPLRSVLAGSTAGAVEIGKENIL